MSDTQMRRGGHRPVERKAYFQGVPWEVDVMLPAQFVAPPARQPEKRLMLAVLEDALLAALSKTPQHHVARQEARDWLRSNRIDWPFSAVNICEALGFDIGWIRERIVRADQGIDPAPPTVDEPAPVGRFARIAREVRTAYGLTQHGLGAIMGRDVKTVGNWERGVWEPERDAQRQLLRMYDRRPVRAAEAAHA